MWAMDMNIEISNRGVVNRDGGSDDDNDGPEKGVL